MLRYLLSGMSHPGATPGALHDDVQPAPSLPLKIWRMDVSADQVKEASFETFDDCPDVDTSDGITWLHFQGNVPLSVLTRLRGSFHLHPLAVEDVHKGGQRPKLEVFDDYLFVVMTLPVRADGCLRFEQVSLFVGRDELLSFHAGQSDVFASVRQRLHAGKGRIRTGGTDYLLYALADVVVDCGFPLLDVYADELEELEEEIFTDPRRNPVGAIHALKRDFIALRKLLWHQSAMFTDIIRSEHVLIDAEDMPYFRDVDDHARRIIDLLDGFRDNCTSLLSTHLSLSSARLNDVMKVLTIISTIFLPLSFIAGVYGMNFDRAKPWNMPELGFAYGYPIVLAVMATVGVGMLGFFRWRKWL
ncbi:MAG: magnesium/cobalt transporter CorA [Salinisphaera sp.]|nr:magnesium/cobalt transporter CorA [Salinisphaera sp.]